MALKDDLAALLPQPNVQAFLRLIRKGEGPLGPEGYRTIFGGEQFTSFADHPRKAVTKSLGGRPITSTAAGAYQFLSRTWDECARALALPDFSPASQDLACLFLIWRRKALDAVVKGDVQTAIDKCKLEWASLPGSPYGQPTQKLADAVKFYEATLATLQTAPVAAAPVPPTPTQPDQEPHVTPLLIPLATALVNAFTPLAKEKIVGAMNKVTDSPQVAEQVATGVIEAAKAASGMDDPVQAVAAVSASPDMLQRAETASLNSLDALLPVVERLAKMDQASVDSARAFNEGEPLMLDTAWIKLKFIHVLSLLFVVFSGLFVLYKWETLTAELKGAVITLMVIAGWNGVRDYWMGSSDGSARKTEQLARRP